MKTQIKTLQVSKGLTKDVFLVILGISVILLAVQAGYYFHLIKNYSWQ